MSADIKISEKIMNTLGGNENNQNAEDSLALNDGKESSR